MLVKRAPGSFIGSFIICPSIRLLRASGQKVHSIIWLKSLHDLDWGVCVCVWVCVDLGFAAQMFSIVNLLTSRHSRACLSWRSLLAVNPWGTHTDVTLIADRQLAGTWGLGRLRRCDFRHCDVIMKCADIILGPSGSLGAGRRSSPVRRHHREYASPRAGGLLRNLFW